MPIGMNWDEDAPSYPPIHGEKAESAELEQSDSRSGKGVKSKRPVAPPFKEVVRAAIHRAALATHNPSPFRFLNDAEIAAINAWAKRGKLSADSPIFRVPEGEPKGSAFLLRDYLLVSYHRTQGGFTICTLSFKCIDPTGGFLYEIRTGASRRSFKDPYNPVKGEMLALFRAVRSRPVTLP